MTEKLDAIHETLLAQSRESPCKKAGSRFVSNRDGTVTDICTGLMWQDATSSFDIDLDGTPDSKFNFNQALLVAQSSNIGGYTDWRLPTFSEIEEITVFMASLPYLITTIPSLNISFHNNFRCWTSTERDEYGAYTAFLETNDQEFYILETGKNTQQYVWLVRGGD
jgi:hypothetical protein